jgi:dienelactone hydrolase
MWVERAVPDQTAKGPRHAKGAVIWLHGLALYEEDSTAPTPPYVKALEQQGWDTFRLNRMRAADSLDGTSARLARAALDLRTRGYGRIVLAGQSFGAFAALAAVSRDGVADAVVATAPAAYGSFTDSYASWRANATELYGLLGRIGKTPVMLVYFHGDDYDPGGRSDASQAILARRTEPGSSRDRIPDLPPDLIIDQPADLTGHAAAATGLFARRYAACIDRFAAGELRSPTDAATCEAPWGRRPSAELAAAPFGATLAPNPPAATGDLTGAWYGFYRNGREVLLRIDKVQGERVSATYLLGPGLNPEEHPESSRREGRLEKGELVFDEPHLNPLRYRLRPDGALAGTWQARDGSGSLDTVLRRMP